MSLAESRGSTPTLCTLHGKPASETVQITEITTSQPTGSHHSSRYQYRVYVLVEGIVLYTGVLLRPIR